MYLIYMGDTFVKRNCAEGVEGKRTDGLIGILRLSERM